MYLLPVYNNKYNELIIIDDEDDLKKIMTNYVNDILDYDTDSCFAPFVITFYDYLYYVPNENELDYDFIKDSELIDDYQCINDEDVINYIANSNKYKEIKYKHTVDVKIELK